MKQLTKRIIAISIVAALMFLTVLLSGCLGYNGIMRKHFSDSDNYYELTVEVTRIYFYVSNKNYEKPYIDITGVSDVAIETDAIYYIDGKLMSGNVPYLDEEDYAKQFEFHFEVSLPNILHLLSTDFYDTVKVGDSLNLRSTMWTYWDRQWNYVAEISLNGTTYLTFEEGLQNIIDEVNANKSLI